MLRVPVTTATTAAPAAALFACAFRGTIAGLALFHGSQGLLLILPRRPLRLLPTFLRLALTLFLIAVASLFAAFVRILARAAALPARSWSKKVAREPCT